MQYSMRYWLKREMKQHRLHAIRPVRTTRSDHFTRAITMCLSSIRRYLWVPHVEDAGGVCDRHVVCSSRDLYKCLSLADQLLVRPEVYDGWIGNMEMWWELRLYELGLLRRLRWFRHVRCSRWAWRVTAALPRREGDGAALWHAAKVCRGVHRNTAYLRSLLHQSLRR